MLAGFERQRPLDRSGHGEAAMPGWIAIAIAGRPGRAALAQGPGRAEACARRLRQQARIWLGRGAHAVRRQIANIEQRLACDLGIDNCATEEILGGARRCQKRCRKKSAG